MTILEYIKSRRNVLFLFLLCSVIHMVVLFVYGHEAEPIWYATALYLLLLFFLGIIDYLHVRNKWLLLHAYDIHTDKSLPELIRAENLEEKGYQKIVLDLQRELVQNTNDYLQRERENSDFYTMWVHQIKTPIAAQRILLQTSPENVSGLKSELFKIDRYVDIILNYLRMENIHQDLMIKHYSLEPLVRQAVKNYSSLFIQSKLSLKLDDLSLDVLTDEKWLVFVIEQLLSNAIKYTKTGGIRVYGTVSEEGDKRITRLCIEDTGIGIHPEDLPRIFERAFTGYNGRTDKKASGLGLYLCKTILHKLGHDISIASTPGEGTCVTVSFYEDGDLCGNLTKM